MHDLSDVLTRIRQVPLTALVAELRARHENGAAPDGRLAPAPPAAAQAADPDRAAHAAVATATQRSPLAATDALAPVLELLRRASSAATTPPAAPALTPAPRTPARDERYALLQRHFGEHELELRRHARLTDRILDQLERGELASEPPVPAPLQQEVRLLCAPGATSGARFVLGNDLGRPVLVVLRARPLRDAAALDGLEIRCEPHQVELPAGAEILACVHVDLGRCAPVVPHGALELVIDALVDDQVVQKIWVALSVREAPPVDGTATP